MLKDLLKKKRRQGAEPNSMMNWSPGMPGYEYQANGVNWHQGGGFPQTQPFYQGPAQSWPGYLEQSTVYQVSGPIDTTLTNQGYTGPLMTPYNLEPYQMPLAQGAMPNSAPLMQNAYQNQMPNGYPPYPMAPEMNSYPKQQPNPFQNPLYQQDEDFYPIQPVMNITHPYPKPSFLQKNQGNNISSVLNQFKNQEGSIDFNKMMDTTGQMLNTMNQVSNLVKGVGSIFKVGT